MQYEIKHIHENLGVSMVYVTHDQSEALTMSNRIAVFDDGIIQQLAPPDELYELPDNAFVAAFIGENNKLDGQGDRGKRRHLLGRGRWRRRSKRFRSIIERRRQPIRPCRCGRNGSSSSPTKGLARTYLDAKVEELIYLGDHMRTRVSLCGHDDFIVKVPNSAGHVHLVPGEAVKVGWHRRGLQSPRCLEPGDA